MRIHQPTTPRLAHERAILDRWKEDDGVYVTLRAAFAPPVSGPDAALAEVDLPAAPAFLRPPTPR